MNKDNDEMRVEGVKHGELYEMASNGDWWVMACFGELIGTSPFMHSIERAYYWNDNNPYFQMAICQPGQLEDYALPFFVIYAHKDYMSRKQMLKKFNKHSINHFRVEGKDIPGEIIIPFESGCDATYVQSIMIRFADWLKLDGKKRS